MNRLFLWLGVYLVFTSVLGCDDPSAVGRAKNATASVAPNAYDAMSWKQFIDDSCQSYFDGCNNCVRGKAPEQTLCTRKVCQVYQQPRCLDVNSHSRQVIDYRCAEGAFTVYIGEFPGEDETLVLEEGNIVLQESNGKATLLTRVKSGSGERYEGGGLMYWNKGDNALVHKNDAPLYRQCVSEQVNDDVLSH